ncbi:MAG: choice-of-anchor D domain-containing protein [Acidobacteriaceae bacterium]
MRRGRVWIRGLALAVACMLMQGMVLGQLRPPRVKGPAAVPAQREASKFVMERGIAKMPRGQAARDYAKALTQLARAQATGAASGSGTWTPVGPQQVHTSRFGLITGRVTSIAADPSDPSGNTVFIGTTGGGVWRSTNAAGPAAGVTFTPLTDTTSAYSPPNPYSLSIGAVSVQPGGTGVILAGTGDPNDASDSYYGEGLLRSTDGGQTWTRIAHADLLLSSTALDFYGVAFSQFAWSTVNPNLVVAAVTDTPMANGFGTGNNPPNTALGLYFSTDAGATWTFATLSDGGQVFESPQLSDLGGNAATSVVWNPVRQEFIAAIRYHGYYESTDGQNWTRLANQPGVNLTTTLCPTDAGSISSPGCPIYRGTVAVQPATGDTFAITVDANDEDQGIWEDACNAGTSGCANPVIQFGKQLADTAIEASDGSGRILQGTYDLSLEAVPWEQDTILLVGTRDIYRCSLAQGCVWRNTTNVDGCAAAMVAPSQHAMDATFGAQGLVYFGNDGGLWRTTDVVNQTQASCGPDDAVHFQNLNAGLGSLADVKDFAVSTTQPDEILAALGVAGTAGTGAQSAVWQQVLDGEGDRVAIDPANDSNWFATTDTGVAVSECTNGTGCTPADFQPVMGAVQVGASEAAQQYPAAWKLDALDSTQMLVGTCRAWRGAADGTGWSSASGSVNELSTMLDGVQQSYCDGNQLIESMSATASGSAGAEQIYAGMTGAYMAGLAPGHVFTQTIPAAPTGPVTWTDLTEDPVTNTPGQTRFNPYGYEISSLYADPHDATGQTIYATTDGFWGSSTFSADVYGSTDGGQDWQDLNNNLPKVPASSVVVDPNNSQIVYVATDAGVWYTLNISSCADFSQPCWNPMGTGLPYSPVVKLRTVNEGSQSLLLAATYGRGIWEIPLLTAGVANTSATISPALLDFGNQQVQTVSAPQTATVTVTGSLDLNVTSTTVSGDFNLGSNSCTGTVAAGATCTVDVSFAPTATGSRTGTLTIFGNVQGGDLSVPLSGTGTTPASVVLTPSSLSFGTEMVGGTSTAQDITVSNTGSNPATISQVSVIGDFAISANTCGNSLAGQTSCTLSIVFQPVNSGTSYGSVTVTDSAGTQTAQLSGTGQSPATDTVSPASLTFATQQVGTTSAAQTVTVTNNGDASLAGIQVAVTGDFTAANGCGTSLTGHSSCSINVSYVPTQTGAETGTLTVTDTIGTHVVALSGTGLAGPSVTLTPSPLNFGGYGVGQTAPAQTVTLTNNGGVALSSITATATAGFSIASNTCSGTLAVGSSCAIGVSFTPAAAGAASGTLTVVVGSSSQTYTVQLNGFGDDFTLGSTSSTSATVTSGQTATYGLSATPVGGTTGAIAFSCSGAPAGASCAVTPAQGTLDGVNPFDMTLTVVTGLTTASASPLQRPGQWPGALLCLAPWFWLELGRWRKKGKWRGGAWRAGIVLAVMLGCASAMSLMGCGVKASGGTTGTGGSGSGGSGSGSTQSTPPGSYVITVTAKMAGVQKTFQVNLTVE